VDRPLADDRQGRVGWAGSFSLLAQRASSEGRRIGHSQAALLARRDRTSEYAPSMRAVNGSLAMAYGKDEVDARRRESARPPLLKETNPPSFQRGPRRAGRCGARQTRRVGRAPAPSASPTQFPEEPMLWTQHQQPIDSLRRISPSPVTIASAACMSETVSVGSPSFQDSGFVPGRHSIMTVQWLLA
jgi:hypothetical protein